MTLRDLFTTPRWPRESILLLVALTALPAFAQSQSKGQQACINGLGSAASRVAKAQAKENSSCQGLVAKGTDVAELPGGSAFACIATDPKGKVAKVETKTLAVESSSCTPAPDFGYKPAADINEAARAASRALFDDLFGSEYATAAVTCESNRAACRCQASILKATNSSFVAKLKLYLACAKSELADGATSVADLDRCLDDGGTPGSVVADTKGKLAKQDAKLEATAVSACIEPSLDTGTLFPGECAGSTGDPDFADCIDDRVECRLCEMLERNQALGVDCDLFDDGAANASCVDFPGFAIRVIAPGYYVGATSDTGLLLVNQPYPTAALDYFELVHLPSTTLLRNSGNGQYVRIDDGDSFAYADADEAAATSWAIFIDDEDDDVVILRDGPVSASVDALRYDSDTGRLKLVNTPVIDVFNDPAFAFRFEQ